MRYEETMMKDIAPTVSLISVNFNELPIFAKMCSEIIPLKKVPSKIVDKKKQAG